MHDNFEDTDSKNIFILQDKAAYKFKDWMWILIVKLMNFTSVRDLIMIDNIYQLSLCFLTAKEKINEFVEQDMTFFYIRLLTKSFSLIRLKIQYHMHSFIFWFLNWHTYQNELTDVKFICIQTCDIIFNLMFISFINNTIMMNLSSVCSIFVCLNVMNEICTMNTTSLFKMNIVNVNMIMSLLHQYWKKLKKSQHNITIIVLYWTQKILYIECILLICQVLGISVTNLVRMMTIDEFQKKKSNIVILNTVMTNKLEFLKKKKQINVICIKMKDSLIMIARIELILNDHYKNWKKNKNINTDLWVMNSKLFLVVYFKHLHFNNHDFFKKKVNFHESSFKSSTSWQIMSFNDVKESEQNSTAISVKLN